MKQTDNQQQEQLIKELSEVIIPAACSELREYISQVQEYTSHMPAGSWDDPEDESCSYCSPRELIERLLQITSPQHKAPQELDEIVSEYSMKVTFPNLAELCATPQAQALPVTTILRELCLGILKEIEASH